MDDQTAIAISAGVTFASVAGGKISQGEIPSGRFVAATCLAFAGLGLVAMASPEIGKGLAVSVAGTAFITAGLPLVLKMFPDTSGKMPPLPFGVKRKDLRSLHNPTANALNKTAQKGK